MHHQPVPTPARILIVDNDADLARGLRLSLEIEHYRVAVETDEARAASLLKTFVPDLVILDLTLPGIDGCDLLRQLRATDDETCVIILSGRTREGDRVAAFRTAIPRSGSLEGWLLLSV
jgi:DNA-binding response OmpR family regulator